MKVLVVLTACAFLSAKAAIYEPDSEVIDYRPLGQRQGRRRPQLELPDLFRQLMGGGRFPLGPTFSRPRQPVCDEGRFELSEPEFEQVVNCRREHQDVEQLEQCVVDSLAPSSADISTFLSRENHHLASVRTSISLSIRRSEVSLQRSVILRMCPDEPASGEGTSAEEDQTVSATHHRHTGMGLPWPGFHLRPFEFPEPEFQMRDIDNMFNSMWNQLGLHFDSFPDLDLPDLPSHGVDFGNCVTEQFEDLSPETFRKVQACHFSEESFQTCLRNLEPSEDSKELVEFAGDEEHVVVQSGFFTVLKIINGTVTRRGEVTLTRCRQPEETEVPAESGEVPAESGEAPSGPEEPETPAEPQSADGTETLGSDTDPGYRQEQDPYGSIYEP